MGRDKSCHDDLIYRFIMRAAAAADEVYMMVCDGLPGQCGVKTHRIADCVCVCVSVKALQKRRRRLRYDLMATLTSTGGRRKTSGANGRGDDDNDDLRRTATAVGLQNGRRGQGQMYAKANIMFAAY